MAGAEKSAAFFHLDRAGINLRFQASAAAHMDNPSAVNGSLEMSSHLEMPGLQGKRQNHPGLFVDNDRWSGNPTGADASRSKGNLAFGPKNAVNAPSDDGRSANYPGAAQASPWADDKPSSNLHLTGGRRENRHVPHLDGRTATGTNCVYGMQ